MKTKWNAFISIGLSLLFLSACVEVTDIESGQDDKKVAQYQALGMAQPNQYSILIPLSPQEVAVRKFQSFQKAATAPVQILVENKAQLIDEQVVAGQTYFYQLGYIENGNLVPVRTLEVVVPKDRVFHSGDQELSEVDLNSHYGRVFFSKGSKVRTNGANWILKASRIISQDGEIYTFPEGKTAVLGQQGRGGGEIRIQAAAIEGTLNFTMRGEHGGKGKQGAELSTRAGKGTSGKPGKGRFSPPRSNVDAEYCTEQAVSAGDGAPGLKQGNRGGDGERGGDSGNIIVEVGGLAGAVRANFYEGLGGEPGDGGLGERGGEPGDFDEKKNFGACKYRKAHEGPRGPQGEQGSSGLPGLRGKVCQQIGKQKMECRQGT